MVQFDQRSVGGQFDEIQIDPILATSPQGRGCGEPSLVPACFDGLLPERLTVDGDAQLDGA